MGRAEEFAREFKLLKAESNRIKQRARENYLEQVSDFSEKIKKGETILIPAQLPEIKFITNSASFLEVYIP